MVRTFASLLVLLGLTPFAAAQSSPLPPQPIPVITPQGPAPGPPAIVPRTELPPNNNPIVPATPIFYDPAPTPYVAPLGSDRRASMAPGFYGSLEIDLVFPQLHGWLSGPVNVMGFQETVNLSSAGLDATGSPRVEVGYRLGDGMGAVAISYRSVVSQGGTNVANFDVFGQGYLQTRLNLNVVDIDYVSEAFNIAPFWDIGFRGGIRGAACYFDNQITGSFAQQQATNNFLGAGPHASIELGRALDMVPGLAVTAKLDGALLFGNISQSFEETLNFADGSVGGSNRYNSGAFVPTVTFNIGFSYTPPGAPKWARFGFGYQYEYWWDLGTRGDSQGDFSGNALYFRGEFNF